MYLLNLKQYCSVLLWTYGVLVSCSFFYSCWGFLLFFGWFGFSNYFQLHRHKKKGNMKFLYPDSLGLSIVFDRLSVAFSLEKRLVRGRNYFTSLTSYSKSERLPILPYNPIYIRKSSFQSHPFCCNHLSLKSLKSWTALPQEYLCLITDLVILAQLQFKICYKPETQGKFVKKMYRG